MIHGRPLHLRAGSTWALASVSVALAAGLVRTIVVARFLEPVDIGLMGIAVLALGFVEAVASTGLDTTLVAERNDVERDIDPAFTIQLVRGVAVSIVLWLSAPAVAWIFHNDGAVSVIRGAGAIPALRGLANPAVALAIRRFDFRRVFWWSLPEVLSSLAITLALAVAWRSVWALVIGAVAAQAAATLASYGLVPRRPRFVLAGQRMRELLRVSRFVTGSRALMYFSVNLDSAVVGIALGTRALGFYQFAMRAAELPVVTFTRAIAQVALPSFSGERGSDLSITTTWRALRRSVIVVNGAAAIAIVLFGDAVVRVIAGDRWLPAVPVMRILALAMVCRALIVLTGQLLDAVGQPALTMRLNAVRLASLIVLLPPLAAYGGLLGVAQAILIGTSGAALFAHRLAARVLPR